MTVDNPVIKCESVFKIFGSNPEKMLEKKGYVLVGCNITGVNAFFVRKDQIQDKFEKNSSSEFHFTEGRYWLKRAFDKNYRIRLK